MPFFRSSHLYTRLRDKIPTSLQWQQGDSATKGDPRKSVKWIDGLRGIASFLVVLTHLARAWDYDLFSPRDTEDATPRILQWPILRIPWQGRVGVTIFAFLTGYVCALKPIKQSRSGDKGAALTTVAKSAFRRPPRLILPATIALLISWVVAQFGGFIVANRSDCWWCRYAAPELEDSFWKEVVRLGGNFLSTWTTGYMAYDDHQWALLPLLMSSMLVYIMLVATVFMRFKYRMLVYIGMMLYFHQDAAKNTETFQLQAIYGMLLSDLSYDTTLKTWIQEHRYLRKAITFPLAILGLLIASYPGENPEWATWSNGMFKAATYIFPPDVNIGKRYTAIGVDMIILAIYLSPTTKDFLANRVLLWLGKQSFAVYLIHGTMLRVVLCWMLYGITGQPWDGPEGATDDIRDDWLPLRSPWVVGVSIPIWIGLVYACATAWTAYVDTFCARMTAKIEKAVFVRIEGEKESLPLPATSIPMQTA
ncbi:uncharacterized protein N7503_011230 [Penicillium pulvis]|uniref:uncharacterized protein n=1 Tax=Penicillium pulvis TaxID=1562058 RepID=UPI00254913B3|nr:uncharacterized protein N7503_011230 [Penicillium pulvis]KAJ5786018.1 hypothetical protein N7503_011230 [Penicillium pulvis]